MRFIFSYLKPKRAAIVLILIIKIFGSLGELLLPYVLEHLIDNVAPAGEVLPVIAWGLVMMVLAVIVRWMNVNANRRTVRVAGDAAYSVRRDLFAASLRLSGRQMDELGLPSIISRMTSDSYNVQSFIQNIFAGGVRAPIRLLGGIAITMTMDVGLSMILVILAPIMIAAVVGVSLKGIPLYQKVQRSVDELVRVMRENITGIRVVKALSKENVERRRFHGVNETMVRREKRAGIVMSLPGPVMMLAMNAGLTLVVLVGAQRVNAGQTQPGVILAFLTYFNMILMGVMGINRVFMMASKANASAGRIREVVEQGEELPTLPEAEGAACPTDGYVVFDHVSFLYDERPGHRVPTREQTIEDVSFSIPKGGSLGIIGPTGCGKTSIINLLMRFYEAGDGHVFVDGKDVRCYEKQDLRRLFGVVFQNDVIFADTIEENVSFGREVSREEMERALAAACAAEFVEGYPEGVGHRAEIHGANFSGGQRQRLLISRALAGRPQILILDDASSALDYRTDAAVRRHVREGYGSVTSITVAQRVSSVMSMDEILVLDEGRVIGRGTHAELLAGCEKYRRIYENQMGEGE